MTERIRRQGVRVLDTVSVHRAEWDDRVRSVLLSDGTSLPADVVVVAVGAVPATEWLAGSEVKVDDGVLCDETLSVLGCEDVVAAGDVARWPHPALGGATTRLEHWTNSAEAALAAGRRLVLGTGPAFAPVPSFWSDQFGLRLQGVGFPSFADRVDVVEGDLESASFVAEYRKGEELVAALVSGGAKALIRYHKELARRGSYPAS
jgi:NADPH-dependent 2,4-dienoyl-CoA reductase/sulfur reductase-like enzyme